ncbi:alginate lyase family protein [Gammaproteobacteria bacterium AB-CW1]|uniref:Alginate lyase family protein n=1 Tax=Natronospira elongata TaxID=3110268 RepID=A0AAP6JJ97_9GAMM|nr:alginate lyase family protein [Gammaproteobacteria bacterium AB-CW1]
MAKLWVWVKSVIRLIPGAVWLKRAIFGRPQPRRVEMSFPEYRGPKPAMAERFAPLDGDERFAKDSFVLYRIIGNDLTPRHRKGQARENLAFILENEPALAGCEKRFVLNRIVDPAEREALVALLERHGMPWMEIPFRVEEYAELGWDIAGVPPEYAPWGERYQELTEGQQGRVVARLYRHKNNYVMHNNGARNAALEDGRGRARWVLPWDGNCFVTESAWQSLREGVLAEPDCPYFIVPMARVSENARLLAADFEPEAKEEPQIVFHHRAPETFDERYCYGRRPKVEWLWRMGVPGIWDEWGAEPWDFPIPDYAGQAGQFRYAGWVARLNSGRPDLEQDNAAVGRGVARVAGITALLDRLDEAALAPRLDPARPVHVDGAALAAADAGLQKQLVQDAEAALERGPYSVVDKTELPPSGNKHDYWHPAPYFWPHPLRIPGMPYVRRDGKRVPGTRLYEPSSDRYDRTRLQRLFDDSFVLALALLQTGERRYGEHAAELLRHWFLKPETAMNPHLNYAQVQRGHNQNRGSKSGVIEMKDLYFYLDAVRIIEAEGLLSKAEGEAFRDWLSEYLDWLLESEQGRAERSSRNNHGTCYDLQVGSIALFLGDGLLARNVFRDSRLRLVDQFEPDGRQPHELARTISAHYCCFNLQCWINLATTAASMGEDLWSFEGPDGQGLKQGMRWLLPYLGETWPFEQTDEFDAERFYPIAHACLDRYGPVPELKQDRLPPKAAIKPLYFPHDGIRPYWQIGRTA